MKSIINIKGLIVVVVISVVIMLLIELFVVRPHREAEQDVQVEEVIEESSLLRRDIVPVTQPERRAGLERSYIYPLIAEFNTDRPPLKKSVSAQRYTLKNTDSNAPARIAIIIDDMGMNRVMSRAMTDVRGVPLTLAFLPYAPDLDGITQDAKTNGHELMIHMPMEPMNGDIDTGPIALHDDMKRDEIDAMLVKAFDSFDGYVGVNNHMGSRLTQNKETMGWVMDSLRDQDLFYVDSKTISTSVAAAQARSYGLDYAERDVFLDHEESIGFVRAALEKTEKVALEKGYAIAIGHPKEMTYQGLKEWIPTLKARGFEIVPVSELLMVPEKAVVAAADIEARSEEGLDVDPVVEKLLNYEPAAGGDF